MGTPAAMLAGSPALSQQVELWSLTTMQLYQTHFSSMSRFVEEWLYV